MRGFNRCSLLFLVSLILFLSLASSSYGQLCGSRRGRRLFSLAPKLGTDSCEKVFNANGCAQCGKWEGGTCMPYTCQGPPNAAVDIAKCPYNTNGLACAEIMCKTPTQINCFVSLTSANKRGGPGWTFLSLASDSSMTSSVGSDADLASDSVLSGTYDVHGHCIENLCGTWRVTSDHPLAIADKAKRSQHTAAQVLTASRSAKSSYTSSHLSPHRNAAAIAQAKSNAANERIKSQLATKQGNHATALEHNENAEKFVQLAKALVD